MTDRVLTAPVALASANAVTQTICSDPTTTELSFDGAAWVPAFPTEPQGAYGATIPGSAWVAPVYNSGVTVAPPGTSHFRNVFTLPAGAKGVTLDGSVHADNQAAVYLNGREIFRQPLVGVDDPAAYGNFQSPAEGFTARQGFVDGLNTVRIDLINWGSEPSAAALDFCLTVSYMAPSDGGGGGGGGGDNGRKGGCPAAPAIAAHYLISLGIQPTSALGKNLVALVGKHMGPRDRFDGYEKCDAGYAPAVVAFVDARRP